MPALPLISIPASAIPVRATYQRDVIERGHVPGVLSGANLRGKARQYGGSYAGSRAVAATVAARHAGAVSALRLVDSRWCRVWVNRETGERVELTIAAA